MNDNLLDGIQQEDKQKIFECLSQAIGEDRQEADTVLELKTHVSGPFLNWDLIYRNLINSFSESRLLYSANKRGMWVVLLLYDKSTNLILSFMQDKRFRTIKKRKISQQPKYIRSLISLNSELQSNIKQQHLFDIEESEDETQLRCVLDELCSGFNGCMDASVTHHALIVFSNKYGRMSSLKAYVLDHDLDVVCEQDWFDSVKPIISNERYTAEETTISQAHSLKPKSLERLRKKGLVSLKEKKSEKQA